MDLPNEVLLIILQHLDSGDIHLSCANVNRRLKNLIESSFDKIDNLMMHENTLRYSNQDVFKSSLKKLNRYNLTQKPNIKSLSLMPCDHLFDLRESEDFLQCLGNLQTLQYLDLDDWSAPKSSHKSLRNCFKRLPKLKVLAMTEDVGSWVQEIALKEIKAETIYVSYKTDTLGVFGCKTIRRDWNEAWQPFRDTTVLHLEREHEASEAPIYSEDLGMINPWIFSRFPNVRSLYRYLLIFSLINLFIVCLAQGPLY